MELGRLVVWMIFAVTMAGISIPIVGILTSKRPRGNAPELERKLRELEGRLAVLEHESADKTLQIETLRRDVAFANKLLESR
jgi:hypothetical protein